MRLSMTEPVAFLYAREVADSVRRLEALAASLRELLMQSFSVDAASNDGSRAEIR